MSRVPRLCDHCRQPYTAETRYLNRNQGMYCSLLCSARSNGQKRTVSREPNSECAWCGFRFYAKPSRVKKSKSGLIFCCHEHKDAAAHLEGIPDIHPRQYGSGSSYRKLAIRVYGAECSQCGYDRHPEILEVNHKDCDRTNNSLNNLEVLCPNCHGEFHFTTTTGKWRPKSGDTRNRTEPTTSCEDAPTPCLLSPCPSPFE